MGQKLGHRHRASAASTRLEAHHQANSKQLGKQLGQQPNKQPTTSAQAQAAAMLAACPRYNKPIRERLTPEQLELLDAVIDAYIASPTIYSMSALAKSLSEKTGVRILPNTLLAMIRQSSGS